jgi:hypothetical protein
MALFRVLANVLGEMTIDGPIIGVLACLCKDSYKAFRPMNKKLIYDDLIEFHEYLYFWKDRKCSYCGGDFAPNASHSYIVPLVIHNRFTGEVCDADDRRYWMVCNSKMCKEYLETIKYYSKNKK